MNVRSAISATSGISAGEMDTYNIKHTGSDKIARNRTTARPQRQQPLLDNTAPTSGSNKQNKCEITYHQLRAIEGGSVECQGARHGGEVIKRHRGIEAVARRAYRDGDGDAQVERLPAAAPDYGLAYRTARPEECLQALQCDTRL